MVEPIGSSGVGIAEVSGAAMPSRSIWWRRCLGALLGISLGSLFLYLAVRKVDLAEVRLAMASTDLRWLVPMGLLALAAFWLRALRWACMFPPHARPTIRQAFRAFMIGALTNNIVPGRLGDVARAGLIRGLVPLFGASGALATIVLEKVVDGLMVLALLGVTFLLAPLPAWLGQMGALGAVISLGMFLVLLVLNAQRKADGGWPNISLQHARFGRVTPALQRLQSRFVGGLNALSNKRQFLMLLALTSVIWLLDISIVFVAFQVFGLTLPFVAAMVTGVLLGVGMMIPAAPGFIGTYQFFAITGLQLYHVVEGQAFAVAVLLNLFVLAVSTLLGLLALSVEAVDWLVSMAARCFPEGVE